MRRLECKPIVVKTKVASHLCKMYELRNENLNAFLGLLNSSPDGSSFKQPHLVWDFGSHGSLLEVIEGETIEMDWTFKLSLLLDLARVYIILISFSSLHSRHLVRNQVYPTFTPKNTPTSSPSFLPSFILLFITASLLSLLFQEKTSLQQMRPKDKNVVGDFYYLTSRREN